MPNGPWMPAVAVLLFTGGWGPMGVKLDAAELQAGFAEVDITPPLDRGPVWMAGFRQHQSATGVHDPIMARTVVLADGAKKIALVSVDLIGLQYPAVQQIRAALPKFDYVLVASTHNHEGPDVIGLWGPGYFEGGLDPAYIARVVERVATAVRDAEQKLTGVRTEYGTSRPEGLLADARLPEIFDDVLRVVTFRRVDNSELAGVLVQWNCHPEALGSRNRLITADFSADTVAHLKKLYHCPIVYFSGPVGGLMTPPDGRYRDADGKAVPEETFDYARRYGEEVGQWAARAIDAAEPIELAPLAVSAKTIAVPLDNPWYLLAQAFGVVKRQGFVWTGDSEVLGEPYSPARSPHARRLAVASEVGYLRLGELHVAAIPGEIYPELVYGQFPATAEPGVDFPRAPLEATVEKLLPGKRVLILGLANDEIGYIIPRRQWDWWPPYAYGRSHSQYGEINSCGPTVAPVIMQALERRVRELE